MITKITLCLVILLGILVHKHSHAATTATLEKEYKLLKNKANDISPQALAYALKAYYHAKDQGIIHNDKLTVVDYSISSTKPRMWVFDMKQHVLKFKDYVTHGSESGFDQTTSFSNRPGSHKSSLGTFLTSTTYTGKDGYSLHLKGLERGINDNAARRAIVVHGAHYATAEFAKSHGWLGRSWGCFAVSKSHARPLIDTIKEGSLIFAYYPEFFWLHHSSFLR